MKSPPTSKNNNGDISKTDSNGESLNKLKENGPIKMKKYMYKLKPSDDPKSDNEEENVEKIENNEEKNSKKYAYVLNPVKEKTNEY